MISNFILKYIGFLAAFCTTFAFLPQALKVWKTKSTKDISLYMFIIFTVGVLDGEYLEWDQNGNKISEGNYKNGKLKKENFDMTDAYTCVLGYLNVLKEKEENLDVKMSLPARIIAGLVSGFISAPMGIGGAVMNVPILKFFGYPINKAIGSAAAIGFIIALFGAVGFLISGSYLNAQLPLSVGFLNIPAFLIFFPITTFMARLGAKASHRINKKKMTKYFGLFLIVIGTRFLFEYYKL